MATEFFGVKFSHESEGDYMLSSYKSPSTGRECIALAPMTPDKTTKRCMCWESVEEAKQFLRDNFFRDLPTMPERAFLGGLMFVWTVVPMKPVGVTK